MQTILEKSCHSLPLVNGGKNWAEEKTDSLSHFMMSDKRRDEDLFISFRHGNNRKCDFGSRAPKNEENIFSLG